MGIAKGSGMNKFSERAKAICNKCRLNVFVGYVVT